MASHAEAFQVGRRSLRSGVSCGTAAGVAAGSMEMNSAPFFTRKFASIHACLEFHADNKPDRPALTVDGQTVSYRQLLEAVNVIGAALQRDSVAIGGRIATIGGTSVEHIVALLGSITVGAACAPLPVTATTAQLQRMVDDVRPSHLFLDPTRAPAVLTSIDCQRIALTPADLAVWSGLPAAPQPVALTADLPFNIIYSSGTTGTPKGIVQPHELRWAQIVRGSNSDFGPESVTLLATPLCSNTTLTGLITTLGRGGHAVFLSRFEAGEYLCTAARFQATHTMLVPIQFQRILAHPDFSSTDLSSFRVKITTGAPMDIGLKREILRRWPGNFHEYYGLSEGGVFCLLDATAHPDKLHTVGKPPAGYELRVIDEAGNFLPPGHIGEIVGTSPTMMKEYFGQPDKTAEIEWWGPDGRRYLRSGDLGRIDADGFLELMGRRKEVIISGGFNIYPKDIEDILLAQSGVAEAAVLGIASQRWGETPVACVVFDEGKSVDADALLASVNGQLGAVQRLSALKCVDSLPRNAMGKILKNELRHYFP